MPCLQWDCMCGSWAIVYLYSATFGTRNLAPLGLHAIATYGSGG
jgi:hypothetical protein